MIVTKSIPCTFDTRTLHNNLTAVISNQHLTIYDVKSKRIFNHIPLERIVRLESDLYRHDLILDQQLPALKLLYQLKVSSTINQLEEITIKTTCKEWNLPRLLKSRIRTKNLGLFYHSLESAKVNFDQECDALIKTYLINDRSIVADTCAPMVESLILQTSIDQSAKSRLFSTCLINILINEIDQMFQWLKKSIVVKPASDIPKFVILTNSGKGIAKLVPSRPTPTHPVTISNSLYFASLCLDWITSGMFDNDQETIKIPRLDSSTNDSGISALDLVNDICDQLKLYDIDDPAYNNLCSSLCSLASEIAWNCKDTIRFKHPEYLAQSCICHLKEWLSQKSNCDQDLLHSYRHCQLLNHLFMTFQVSKSDLKKIPDYKYITNRSHDLPENSTNEKIRLVTNTNETLFLITQ